MLYATGLTMYKGMQFTSNIMMIVLKFQIADHYRHKLMLKISEPKDFQETLEWLGHWKIWDL